jgi:chromosomal replication initiation ATPase DnaA
MLNKDILKLICQYYDVEADEVTNAARGTTTIIKVRDIYFWILSRNRNLSHNEIAKLGKRERSSVTCSLRRTKSRIKDDETFRNEVMAIVNATSRQEFAIQ